MNTSSTNQFEQLVERYLDGLYAFWPNTASFLGRHEYDERQPDLSGAAIQARLAAVREQARALAALDTSGLDADERFDVRLLQCALDLELYQWETERAFQLNPMWYLLALDIVNFLSRDWAPFERRMIAVVGYLQNTPRVMAAARENLAPVLPRPMLEVSLDAFEGMLAFYSVDLQAAIAQVQDDELVRQLTAARQTATEAVSEFLHELRAKYLPAATDEFAIGADNYRRMLRSGDLVDLSLETLLELGERDLARNLTGVREKARQINPDLEPSQVAALIKQDHPTAGELIPATAELLEEIRQFLIDKFIVTVPSDVRAQVQETPAFMRWAFARMNTPGPFETVGTQAYYYITPPDPAWPPEKQEEWLSSFSRAALQNTSVHEAYPGHYVQFLHVNYAVQNRLRKALTAILSYAFIEGWAHYTEEMMLDAGYGGHNPKLRFVQLEDALLRDCRYICSIKMHTQGMTVDEATRFFMEHAFMAETPARQEALRGTFDPGYLYYTLGKLMIIKLREDYETRVGTNFNLQLFHDKLLSYGTPPIPLLREAILGPDGGSLL